MFPDSFERSCSRRICFPGYILSRSTNYETVLSRSTNYETEVTMDNLGLYVMLIGGFLAAVVIAVMVIRDR
ncbi:MAG: hypothetical protein UV59_C0012G0008 [Candidatus Gottesmanbacteria bacterium GW2011_GWA1_43_11]|uniref:Uncharacterized protein n=1 Tax=Candidatus Gottesmanbacteria bacterium GW2011_GWA1_43_11 TaxID=1618436 RepID=A0A0G1CGG9_9BACT|nr:MAG: hypothetical protein UV59_C0012G0008 [Candidatus Gottesmanbacteria bacterium GW2011_GWA1_43_11]